jgi:hypothetical protein
MAYPFQEAEGDDEWPPAGPEAFTDLNPGESRAPVSGGNMPVSGRARDRCARLFPGGEEWANRREVSLREKVQPQCSLSKNKIQYKNRACSSGDRATDF